MNCVGCEPGLVVELVAREDNWRLVFIVEAEGRGRQEAFFLREPVAYVGAVGRATEGGSEVGVGHVVSS